MSFQDPSIISVNADNAITKFLQEAESKREQELQQETLEKEANAQKSEQDKQEEEASEAGNATASQEMLDAILNRTNEHRIVYSAQFMLQLKDSPLCVAPADMAARTSFITRVSRQQQQQQRKEWHNNNNNGSSGNSHHHRNDGSYKRGNKFNSRNNKNQRKRDNDEWLAEIDKDEPMGTTAEDFERWKMKVKNADRKRNGEVESPAASKSQGQAQQHTQHTQQNDTKPKNAIDNFFSLTKPAHQLQTDGTSTPETSKSSKFFSFFQPEETAHPAAGDDDKASAADKDGVSKILSLLGPKEENSAKSPPQQNSQRSQFFSPEISAAQTTQPLQAAAAAPSPAPSPAPASASPSQQGGKDSFFLSLLNKTDPKDDQQLKGSKPSAGSANAKENNKGKVDTSPKQSPKVESPNSSGKLFPPPPNLEKQPSQKMDSGNPQQLPHLQMRYPMNNQGMMPMPPNFQNMPPGLPQQIIAQQLQMGNGQFAHPPHPPPGFQPGQQLPP